MSNMPTNGNIVKAILSAGGVGIALVVVVLAFRFAEKSADNLEPIGEHIKESIEVMTEVKGAVENNTRQTESLENLIREKLK